MKIEIDKVYRIKGQSKYFVRKYGTSNPTIRIREPIDVETQGHTPAGFIFLGRIYAEEKAHKPAWYRYIEKSGLGEIVQEDELEEITG